MENIISEIYELLEKSPRDAVRRAEELLMKTGNQETKDSINWAQAYALVELEEFAAAEKIWSDIFVRTGNHMALHQIGYVRRRSGQLEAALKTYFEERNLISCEDLVAVGANFYELAYCNHLLGNRDEALRYFREYEKLEFEQSDLIERGCFFRLKGDIFLGSNRDSARDAYFKSLELFREAQDEVAASEILVRLSQI